MTRAKISLLEHNIMIIAKREDRSYIEVYNELEAASKKAGCSLAMMVSEWLKEGDYDAKTQSR